MGALPGATLQPGSRIAFFGGRLELAERVRVSSGTRLARHDTELAHRYGDDAVLPRLPWRRPSDDELFALYANRTADRPEWRPAADGAIVRVPDGLILPLTDMLERHGIRESGDRLIYKSEIENYSRWSENLAALRQYLTSLGHDRMERLPLWIGQPNQFTLTKDTFGNDLQKLIGLHLDSWDKLPFRHRHRSRNRICINLGRESRYSLFLNLPLMQMFNCLKLRDPEDIYEDFRGVYLGERFMKSRPTYPAIRLRIEPGEAYVLPTDNLIHDASTQGTIYPDIALTFIGHFTPGAPGAQ